MRRTFLVVLESRKREMVGVEVEARATVTEADFNALRALLGLVGARLKCGVALHAGREILPFAPRLWAAGGGEREPGNDGWNALTVS